jgi:hypothetical protein
MNAALKALGVDVRYTEFPGVDHGSWPMAYVTAELWPWMFSHRLPTHAHRARPQH